MKKLGQNIKYYRELKGMTVERLARFILVPPHIIRQVEAGEKGMTIRTLADYSRALEVPAHWLLRDPITKEEK